MEMTIYFCMLDTTKAECDARTVEAPIPRCMSEKEKSDCTYRRKSKIKIPEEIIKEFRELPTDLPF